MYQLKSIWIFKFFSLILVLAIFLLAFTSDIFSDNENYQKEFNDNYSIFAVPLPEDLNFANEIVPLSNFDTYESYDRELLINTYWQSQTLIFIKKSYRYFPIIEPILKKYNVPVDFKYLAIAESGLSNVVSPAGAVGFWQFLKGTGKEYGLEINEEIDERYHIEKSTEAACKYFLKMYEYYQNWTLVAASYNNGKSGLDKQIKIQKQNNYYDLLLNEETARYIFRILAIKTILNKPDKYGFHFRSSDLYQPIETYLVEVNASVNDFADFAKKYDINYKVLKYFNPWLRKNYLTNHKKNKYFIKIPYKFERDFTSKVE